ncbi:L,D-transpeptidase [Antarcticirhabdus aurantiaca]|uniref:L,D-transpeptidase n=1 Tax=Antarcticirhabdus aurantiaca TaxID=2606717 RepID=A0ACD4NWC1_9HYPH|nr:L,D-transpeptidase [Antarcticirhabdus aurantiaca]WAJ31276.1 L,D-transpeptidase [Jeongeuplla avenae]
MPSKSARRAAFLLALPFLGACSTISRDVDVLAVSVQPAPQPPVDPRILAYYGQVDDGAFVIPAIDPKIVSQRNIRQVVDFPTPEPVGTVVVDPYNHHLYLVMEGGQAMRYGIGVGKAGFAFAGTATVARKASWPRWTPTQNMLKREPERFGPHAGGVEGGLGNPLGARALYLYRDGRDTLYRIHGTNEPWTIGTSVSSGCIRMFNQDAIDIEQRVPVGSRVVVLDAPYGSRAIAGIGSDARPPVASATDV